MTNIQETISYTKYEKEGLSSIYLRQTCFQVSWEQGMIYILKFTCNLFMNYEIYSYFKK
jgi:hypothetical protein